MPTPCRPSHPLSMVGGTGWREVHPACQQRFLETQHPMGGPCWDCSCHCPLVTMHVPTRLLRSTANDQVPTTLPTTMGWQTHIADSRSRWARETVAFEPVEAGRPGNGGRERLDDVRRCQSFLLSHSRGTETSSLAVACHVSIIFQIALGELKVDEICPLVIPLHLRYFSTNSPNSCKVPSHGSLDLPPSPLTTPSSFQHGDGETGQAREPRSSSVDGSEPSGRDAPEHRAAS